MKSGCQAEHQYRVDIEPRTVRPMVSPLVRQRTKGSLRDVLYCSGEHIYPLGTGTLVVFIVDECDEGREFQGD